MYSRTRSGSTSNRPPQIAEAMPALARLLRDVRSLASALFRIEFGRADDAISAGELMASRIMFE